jgi:hypothetical protein
MDDLICKYCGTVCKNHGSDIVGKVGGHICSKSPTKKHILVPNPPYCVYCGTETHTQGSSLVGNAGGHICSKSPTSKHQLA